MDEYKRLFDVYLRMAVRLYDPQRPYDNLEVCCRQCIRLREQLLGMCQLLEATGDMTMEEAEKESKRIISEFSTIRLFHAYIGEGECYVYTEFAPVRDTE